MKTKVKRVPWNDFFTGAAPEQPKLQKCVKKCIKFKILGSRKFKFGRSRNLGLDWINCSQYPEVQIIGERWILIHKYTILVACLSSSIYTLICQNFYMFLGVSKSGIQISDFMDMFIIVVW